MHITGNTGISSKFIACLRKLNKKGGINSISKTFSPFQHDKFISFLHLCNSDLSYLHLKQQMSDLIYLIMVLLRSNSLGTFVQFYFCPLSL